MRAAARLRGAGARRYGDGYDATEDWRRANSARRKARGKLAWICGEQARIGGKQARRKARRGKQARNGGSVKMADKRIMTVMGPIAPEQLGWTSMHEHVLMRGRVLRERHVKACPDEYSPIPADEPMSIENVGIISHNGMLTWDAVDLQDEELMAGEVGDFKKAGGDSMTELSAIGIRCSLPGVKRIAEASGVHVVACTGFYVHDSWPEKYYGLGIEGYAAVMRDELRNGIEDTGILPGVLKIGMCSFAPDEEHALRAAARVAAETGLSLTIHPASQLGGRALQAVEAALEEGVAPERVVIAHVSGSIVEHDLKTLVTNPASWGLDMDYPKQLLDAGVNVSWEFLGQNIASELRGVMCSTDWQRMAGLYQLIKEGYAKQIVFGTDTCAKMMTRRFGGEGYLRIWNFAVPSMRNILGISEKIVRQILVDNPARILAY
jgi:phosphotriesterase-related protein